MERLKEAIELLEEAVQEAESVAGGCSDFCRQAVELQHDPERSQNDGTENDLQEVASAQGAPFTLEGLEKFEGCLNRVIGQMELLLEEGQAHG